MTRPSSDPVRRAISRMLRRPTDDRTTLLATGGLATVRVLAEIAHSSTPVAAHVAAGLILERFAFLIWLHTAITALLRKLLPAPTDGVGTLVSIGLLLALLSPLLGMTLGLAPPTGMPWIQEAAESVLPGSVAISLLAVPLAVLAFVRSRASMARALMGGGASALLLIATLTFPAWGLPHSDGPPEPWLAALALLGSSLVLCLSLRWRQKTRNAADLSLAAVAGLAVGFAWTGTEPHGTAGWLAGCGAGLTLLATSSRDSGVRTERILPVALSCSLHLVLAVLSPALALGLLSLLIARVLPSTPTPHPRNVLTGFSLLLLVTWPFLAT